MSKKTKKNTKKNTKKVVVPKSHFWPPNFLKKKPREETKDDQRED